MRLLLDTHVLIWLAEGLDQLDAAARRAIDAACTTDGLCVSAISFWEVAMLAQRGRISLSSPVSLWRRTVLGQPGLIETPVTGDIGVEAATLPGGAHGDPADRLLIATARVLGLRLATHDRAILDYASAGHVRVLAV